MHILVNRIPRHIQPLGDNRHGFLIRKRAALIEHADDAHAVGLFHRLRLFAHGADALAQQLFELASRVLHERLLQIAAGSGQLAEHLPGAHHVGDIQIDAQREMIVLADDIEGRAFKRAPVAGEHQLVDVVLILVDALVVIADVAEDIRRRADLAARHCAVENRQNRMAGAGHIVDNGFAVRPEHHGDAPRLVFQKIEHFFPVHVKVLRPAACGFSFCLFCFLTENVPADLFSPGKSDILLLLIHYITFSSRWVCLKVKISAASIISAQTGRLNSVSQ